MFAGQRGRRNLPEAHTLVMPCSWHHHDGAVDALKKKLECSTVGQPGQPVRIYLDREVAKPGDNWFQLFLAALRNTTILVPVITASTIKTLAAGDRCDNVLLEWWFALVMLGNLQRTAGAGRVAMQLRAIAPVFCGEVRV